MESSAGGAPPTVFEDVRATPTQNGFIIQGSVRGLPGAPVTHIVQVVTVEDGKVAACEEYIAPEMSLGDQSIE
jgi:hypothetical protein